MFSYRSHRLILPLAPTVGAALGLATAAAIAVIPGGLLEALVMRSGIAAVVAAAQPPLGATARLILLIVLGGGVAVFAGVGAWLAFGKRTVGFGRTPAHPQLPYLRRADSHPDAPPRELVRAHRDLGAPMIPLLPEADVAQALPADLDRPLADYDPEAIPAVPLEPARAVAPLARPQLIDPGDRFETFDPAPTTAEIEPTATLHALLDRLERGIARGPRPARSLDEALGELRRLAS